MLDYSKYNNEELLEVFKKALDNLDELIKIQCSDGNWDYDPYMHGMANGMILCRSLFGDGDKTPEYLNTPKEWGYAKKFDYKLCK